MIKIESLKKSDIHIFRKLLLEIFNNGFEYYPENARRYNKNHWDKFRIEKYLKNSDILMLVSREGNEAIGYLIGKYYYRLNKSSILWLGVRKDYREKGVGSKLEKSWEVWSRLKGARVLKASTANFENTKFYESLGFQKSLKIVKNDWGMKKLVFVKKIH